MGKVEQDFQRCVSEGRLSAFGDGPKLVARQLGIAASDLDEARASFSRGNWKWATIQSYYSMFHAARALLYARGFREKHHRCLRIGISHLYSSEGEAFVRLVDDFHLAKELRENADYAEDFSETGAQKLIASADRFHQTATVILSRPAV